MATWEANCGNPRDDAGLLAQVIGVEDHFDLRTGHHVQEGQGFVETGQEGPILGATGVHGLQGHGHAQLGGLGQQLLQGAENESPGMIEGMARPGPAVDHQAGGAHRGGGAEGLGGILDAFAVTASVAAGKAPRPQQVGDLQAAASEQLQAAGLTAIGEFWPPDPNGGDAGGGVMGHVLLERPAEGGRFVHRQFSHACCSPGWGHGVPAACRTRWAVPCLGFRTVWRIGQFL